MLLLLLLKKQEKRNNCWQTGASILCYFISETQNKKQIGLKAEQSHCNQDQGRVSRCYQDRRTDGRGEGAQGLGGGDQEHRASVSAFMCIY